MTQNDRDHEFAWLLKMLELENERGAIVPGGAVGGGGATRAPEAARGAVVSAGMRARARIRYLARAVPVPPDDKAA